MLRLGEAFIAAHAGEIQVEAPTVGRHAANVVSLLELGCDLRLDSIVQLCSKRLGKLQAHAGLALLPSEWVAGAKPDTVRAALAALKLCRR